MPAELSTKGQQLLDRLPPYFADDPNVWAVVDACARELQRLEDAMDATRLGLFPQNADDTYRLLGLWEQTLGMPVEPPSVPVSTRRSNVLARLRGRGAGSGLDWIAALSTAIGSNSWTHQENTPAGYQLTITVGSASLTAGQLAALARSITPAHIDVIVTFGTGFQVGISTVGEDVV